MMIRKDREIDDLCEIIEIIKKCDVCRLALNGDDGYPYIIPLNFGISVNGNNITLYFHSALKGRKHDLIAQNNRAAFQMDCGHDLFSIEERGYCTMNYESVCGRGYVEYVVDPVEKENALTELTDRYHQGNHFPFNPAAMPRTSVYKLVVTEIVGKRKQTKKE